MCFVQSLQTCCVSKLLSELELAHQQSAAARFTYGCTHQSNIRAQLETASELESMRSGHGHVPAVCPRSDALETVRQERHVCLLDHFLEQTQLFCLTLELLYFSVRTHNACSQSPKLIKLKERAPFPPQPFAVCSSDPCSKQNRGFNPLSLLADLGWQAVRPLAAVNTGQCPAVVKLNWTLNCSDRLPCLKLRSSSPPEPASLSHLMVCVTFN